MKASYLEFLVALASLFLVADSRLLKKCCDKLDPDAFRNITQLIASRGYPVEEHSVKTEDNFTLGVQRIPHGRTQTDQPLLKPVVFLQHGLLADSSTWVQNYPHDSLGYILADSGFDVWLGNARGNRYSRHNTLYKPCQREFWDWSFQEMAKYDLPAMLEYALNISGQAQLFYIGHSQGTLTGFEAFSTNLKLANKVKLFVALAPIFCLNHTSAFARDVAFTLYPFEELLHPLGEYEFLSGRFLEFLIDIGFCGQKWSEHYCYDVGGIIFGFDDPNNNMSRVPIYLSNWPAGTSFKNIIHFGQIIVAGRCQKFDYGREGNLRHYHQYTPPVYDVSKMTTPTAFFYGGKDGLSNKTDVQALAAKISNLVFDDYIAEYNHIDFIFGIDAPERLYNRIQDILEKFLWEEE